jgi:hypothetical protein
MDERNYTVAGKVQTFFKKFKRYPAHKKLALILVLVLALPLTVYLVRTFTLYLSRAANAELLFTSTRISLPPNASPGVVVNTGSAQIAFARVELTFDQTKVNLSDEIQMTGPLQVVIGKTSRANANSTGKVVVVMALCNGIDIPCAPSSGAPTAPSGTFELFKVPLTAVTTQSGETTLQYDTATMQLVDTNQTNVTLGNPQTLAIGLNGSTSSPTGSQATSAPTAQPTGNATPTPAGTGQSDTTLRLTVPKFTFSTNETFPVYVQTSTATNTVIGADLDIRFDPAKLRLNDIVPGNFFTNPDTTNKVVDNTNGVGKITVATPPGTSGRTGIGNMAQLTFTAIGQGATTIAFGDGNLVAATGINGVNAIKYKFDVDITVGSSGILGDINRDGCVDIVDYVILFANFGKNISDSTADDRADINNDGRINVLDYTYIFENFSLCVAP